MRSARAARAVAFAFDIDGVLLHGAQPLPGAAAALAAVRAARVPHVFLTNGGGLLESERAAQLEGLLGGPVHTDQVILAHTPMKAVAPSFAATPVLAVGGKNTLAVARAYGMTRAYCPYSVARAYKHAVPLAPGGGPPPHVDPLPAGVGTRADPFKAVVVFHDPACYTTDLQIVLDVLVGGGVVNERPPSGGARVQPPLLFSNPDLLYANGHPAPRIGQGAFQLALSAVYREITGRDLKFKMYGKPTAAPFVAARAELERQAVALGVPPSFAAIYMVGDNPTADIAGARAAGAPWRGLLVRSGVATDDCATHPAHAVFDGVGDAVAHGLEVG